MNVLFLFSDEHRYDAMGCAGHSLVKTPNLDTLAATGTRYTNSYTSSPICVPARASLATGQYVHNTGCWSNAQAYQGTPQGWGHRLQGQGTKVESIGKLHYRGAEFNNGFDREILPLYIHNGTGWIKGLLRDHESVLDCSGYAAEIGPGDSSYTDFDLGVTREACNWIVEQKKKPQDKPWVLFVSWLRPHYPLFCPKEFYDLYPLQQMDQARFTQPDQLPTHPVLKAVRKNFDYDRYFDDQTRQVARASYYGLCSFLDFQIGQVLDALDSSGLKQDTLIIYTSDHGDHNGDRGMWTKMTMYDESSRVPMIIAGEGFDEGTESSALTSLIDIYPTIMQATGTADDGVDRPGMALQEIESSAQIHRAILSEYHDGGSPVGMFMLRYKHWKYNYYPGYEAELFDMEADPGELKNLAGSDEYQDIEIICRDKLFSITDPEVVNKQAFFDQANLIQELGGASAIMASDEYDFTPVS